MSGSKLDNEIDKYLKDNPEIQEALDIFSISTEQYRQAIESLSTQQTVTNFKDTNINGNLARNF